MKTFSKSEISQQLWRYFLVEQERNWGEVERQVYGTLAQVKRIWLMQLNHKYAGSLYALLLRKLKGMQHPPPVCAEHTFRQNFKKGRLTRHCSDQTKNAFAVLAGFDNFGEFRRRLSAGELPLLPDPELRFRREEASEPQGGKQQDEAAAPLAPNPPQTPAPAPTADRRDLPATRRSAPLGLLLALGTAVAAVIYLAWMEHAEHQYDRELRRQQERIRQRVWNAPAAEINAYRQLPAFDTAYFDTTFTPQGEAACEIIHQLDKAHFRGHRGRPECEGKITYLSISDSYELGDTVVRVDTEERWYVQTYDPVTGENYHRNYSEENQQYYLLKLRQDNWLIDSNVYKGKARDLLPPVADWVQSGITINDTSGTHNQTQPPVSDEPTGR